MTIFKWSKTKRKISAKRCVPNVWSSNRCFCRKESIRFTNLAKSRIRPIHATHHRSKSNSLQEKEETSLQRPSVATKVSLMDSVFLLHSSDHPLCTVRDKGGERRSAEALTRAESRMARILTFSPVWGPNLRLWTILDLRSANTSSKLRVCYRLRPLILVSAISIKLAREALACKVSPEFSRVDNLIS